MAPARVRGVSVWDDSAVTQDDPNRSELDAALDEVAEQLRDMPRHDIVDPEDRAWSLKNGVEVEVAVQSDEPLILRLEASKGFWFRTSANRTIRIDPQ